MTGVVIITGLSGSGKSTVLNAFEDLGWFCMDNLPVVLLPKVLELAGGQEPIERVAVGVDARERTFIREAGEVVDRLREGGASVQVVYIDAQDDVLVQRFSATRRRHPIDAGAGPLTDAIDRERQLLEALRERADAVIDTTRLNVNELKQRIRDQFGDESDQRMSIRIVSFGFKHGITPEADLVFDVRFLDNPFFQPDLKDRSGLDHDVQRYVLDQDDAIAFRTMLSDLLRFLLPRYEASGKTYLTIAIGCTGGQHRSVAIATDLAKTLERDRWRPIVAHREQHRWRGKD